MPKDQPAEVRNYGKDSACGFFIFEINAHVLFLSQEETVTLGMEPYDCSPGSMHVFPLLTQENANINHIWMHSNANLALSCFCLNNKMVQCREARQHLLTGTG
jgi:hypothetical protein